MSTQAEQIAEDIRWLFHDEDNWAISESEIVDQLDSEAETVVDVLERMEAAERMERKTTDEGRLWALLT